MENVPIDQLAGMTIKEIRVHSNAVVIEFSDGKTSAFIGRERNAKNLRMHVATKRASAPDAPPGVTVYRSDFPYAGELPDYLE